jgi:hypothetical protein
MARAVVLGFLIFALAEGFIDRGRGAPCMVAGRYEPAILLAAFVFAAAAWMVNRPI